MEQNRYYYSMCALFTALIAIGAYIRVPIPVVPFTLQFLFTNLAGLLLGRRSGMLAVEAYVLLGLAGMPIFAGGGGLSYIFQPTFGYILGFVLGTGAAGVWVQRASVLSLKTYLQAGIVNLLIVYLLGLAWFYVVTLYITGTPIAIGHLLWFGFALAVPGDLLLCVCGAVLAVRLQRAAMFPVYRQKQEAGLS